MKRFIEGEARTQFTLLPEWLDDYVTEENPVRVVDVFVDELNLDQIVLGIDRCLHVVTDDSTTARDHGTGVWIGQ